MSYSDFGLRTVLERFGLAADEQSDLFAAVSAVKVPARPAGLLEEWEHQALAINTEKARSVMSIAPAKRPKRRRP
jgi:hypothetical protein